MRLGKHGSPHGIPGEHWVIVTQYYCPEPGAPQIRLRALVQNLTRLGLHVRVLTGMPNYPTGVVQNGYRGKLYAQEVIDGVDVHRVWLYAASGRNVFKRLANYLSFTVVATFYLLFCMWRVDVLFVESQPISLGIAGILMKWCRRVPYVYNIPDLQTDVARELAFLGAKPLLGLAVALENLLMRQAWTVSTVTHRFIDYYVKRGIPREKLSFLPNGVDVDALKPLPRDECYAKAMGVHGKKAFTYAGTHAFYHGLEVLIEAACYLKSRQDIVLLLVGQGPLRARLMQAAHDYRLQNVVFRDSPFSEMAQLMSVSYASLVVMKDIPTAVRMRLSKTFPPLACGVPVIYSGRGESADMVAEEHCGLCVAPQDPRALASAIERLADDPALRNELGCNGATFVRRELSWTKIVETWLKDLHNQRTTRGPADSGRPERWYGEQPSDE